VVSFVGGLMLLAGAYLLVWNLAGFHSPVASAAAPGPQRYSLALNPGTHVPAVLNGFRTWNLVLLVLMLIAYGWPVGQFLVAPSPGAVAHRMFGTG
jgi:cytochrome c oxidase subunit 1